MPDPAVALFTPWSILLPFVAGFMNGGTSGNFSSAAVMAGTA